MIHEQGKEIGTQLLGEVLDYHAGYPVTLKVVEDTPVKYPAVGYYKRRGFVDMGKRDSFKLTTGHVQPLIVMQRPASPKRQ